MSDSIASRLARIEERISAAAARSGRPRDEVTLVAVSKTFPATAIDEAVLAGVTDIGENRVQEFREKAPLLRSSPRRHLIGHLQTNKANDAARLFDVVQSVDRIELAQKLGRAAEREDRSLDVLLQVNVGGEEQKSGCDVDELPALIEAVVSISRLRLIGLMTVPPQVQDPEAVRPFFQQLRGLRDANQQDVATLQELSMGMSEDFEVAVEEGATMIRLGRAIFGGRG